MEKNLLAFGILILVIAANYGIEYFSALPRTHGIAPTAEQAKAAHSHAKIHTLVFSVVVVAVVIAFILAQPLIRA